MKKALIEICAAGDPQKYSVLSKAERLRRCLCRTISPLPASIPTLPTSDDPFETTSRLTVPKMYSTSSQLD